MIIRTSARAAILLGLCAVVGCSRNQGKSDGGAPIFVDVAEPSGVASFVHSDGSSGRKFFIEQMGSGVAVFDYDGDGWMDLYFCSGNPLPGYKGAKPSNRLFRNKHDGTFEDVTEKAGLSGGRYNIGVASGDYDNDGDVDLYLCAYGENQLFRNNGDGTFSDVTASAGVGEKRLSSSAAWGDYDADGDLDLYVANYVRYKLENDRWCSQFAGHKSYCGPNLYDPETHTLYRNNGDGTFANVSVSSGIAASKGNGLGVVWIDADGDGKLDLFVANDQSPNFLWHNNGDGTFRDIALESGVAVGDQGNAQAGMGIDSGDYDNDGRPDVLVTNFSEETNSLYHNEGGNFRDRSYASGMGALTLTRLGFGAGFLDYDRDGWLDMFFANGHVMDDIDKYSDVAKWKQPNQLFRNTGDGKFVDVSKESGIGVGENVARGAAFGDLFNRGRTDVVVNVLRGKPRLMRNNTAPDAHWIRVDLKAVRGNPQGIGSTVTVKAGSLVQRRDVRMNTGYASSSDHRPLFGLGKTTKIDEVRVLWPDGTESMVTNPKIDQPLLVEQSAR